MCYRNNFQPHCQSGREIISFAALVFLGLSREVSAREFCRNSIGVLLVYISIMSLAQLGYLLMTTTWPLLDLASATADHEFDKLRTKKVHNSRPYIFGRLKFPYLEIMHWCTYNTDQGKNVMTSAKCHSLLPMVTWPYVPKHKHCTWKHRWNRNNPVHAGTPTHGTFLYWYLQAFSPLEKNNTYNTCAWPECDVNWYPFLKFLSSSLLP